MKAARDAAARQQKAFQDSVKAAREQQARRSSPAGRNSGPRPAGQGRGTLLGFLIVVALIGFVLWMAMAGGHH
jgi:hypothetical protein